MSDAREEDGLEFYGLIGCFCLFDHRGWVRLCQDEAVFVQCFKRAAGWGGLLVGEFFLTAGLLLFLVCCSASTALDGVVAACFSFPVSSSPRYIGLAFTFYAFIAGNEHVSIPN
jgi:hypothetical protein